MVDPDPAAAAGWRWLYESGREPLYAPGFGSGPDAQPFGYCFLAWVVDFAGDWRPALRAMGVRPDEAAAVPLKFAGRDDGLGWTWYATWAEADEAAVRAWVESPAVARAAGAAAFPPLVVLG
jgi:hypothetical protein